MHGGKIRFFIKGCSRPLRPQFVLSQPSTLSSRPQLNCENGRQPSAQITTENKKQQKDENLHFNALHLFWQQCEGTAFFLEKGNCRWRKLQRQCREISFLSALEISQKLHFLSMTTNPLLSFSGTRTN